MQKSLGDQQLPDAGEHMLDAYSSCVSQSVYCNATVQALRALGDLILGSQRGQEQLGSATACIAKGAPELPVLLVGRLPGCPGMCPRTSPRWHMSTVSLNVPVRPCSCPRTHPPGVTAAGPALPLGT
jgi:hypothetical protein